MTSLKKKISAKSLSTKINNKPNTVTRAGITANLVFTRGKQLVEHNPFSLIPDPQNPRPGEIIDDKWLLRNLRLGLDDSLCGYNSETNTYEIPELHELNVNVNEKIEESYNFLKGLALSIRNDGLIEPIEIFLADKNNDPDYFVGRNDEYGYVVLEGHQRRLAAMMAGMRTITCIEITDETLLAKLKVRHRKLRRQLSENNLRKGLTVYQNFEIVKKLLDDDETKSLTRKELSAIIGLNEAIAGALKEIITNSKNYPNLLYNKISDGSLTFKKIRELAFKPYDDVLDLLKNEKKSPKVSPTKKVRGKQGGAIKRSASFKVKDAKETHCFLNFLYRKFPEVKLDAEENEYKKLESFLMRLKEMSIVD
ncbi:TPA: chromosome partitioning protein ParB [Legionella pneumophila]|nr:chromosome partitioning protein ParB [Legionella pneumophila]HBD7283640.1 chromosome partitioning protein ParB [Legionella pneumophila]HEN8241159.1 chromosome partitioning protein ParB [Legionella pneumophila]